MNYITIEKTSITELTTDIIVNAANEGLRAGSGVCGAIFEAAGMKELQDACDLIGGHCDTGSAVITPGFNLKAKYVIHAVGPVWRGGDHQEPQLLYGAYYRALELVEDSGCHSVGFPLISAGIFGYPKDKAWKVAIQACREFFDKHPQADIHVVFAILDDGILELGRKMLEEDAPQYTEESASSGEQELRDQNGYTEQEAITLYRSKNYPKPALTADIAVFAKQDGVLRLLMIKRGGHPFLGCWALPGGFAEAGETIGQSALRELEEETGVRDLPLSLVGIYSKPGRDPRGWTVSAAYTVLLPEGTIKASAGDDAAEAEWIEVRVGDKETEILLPDEGSPAFDHEEIIADAVRHLQKEGLLPEGSLGDDQKQPEQEFTFFWNDDEENGIFSNWYRCTFVVDDYAYRHVEQYMMAQKAKLFHDAKTYTEILRTNKPWKCKKLGREVRPFDSEKWDAVRYEIVKAGNRAKYEQNPELKEALLKTGDSVLAEASPKDLIWGIGLDRKAAAHTDPQKWPGQNLMGKILTELREEFRSEEEIS